MTDTTVSAEGTYERMLKAMPEIASVVNEFTSEGCQSQALGALLTALVMPGKASNPAVTLGQPPLSLVAVAVPDDEVDRDPGVEQPPHSDAPHQGRKPRSRKAGPKKTYARAKGLNFHPDGRPSLSDLAAEKRPTNNDEKNLLIVYYLKHVLEMAEVDLSHVLAAYADIEWKPPANPENSLFVTSSRKDWLDTRNIKAIEVTHKGRRVVEHDMPLSKAGKST